MTTTVTVEGLNIFINNQSLEQIIENAVRKALGGSTLEDKDEKVTFIQLSKELAESGRKISVSTLTKKARLANCKIYRFDGKRLAVMRESIKTFVSL
jgi:hypothetical protein